ncbi:tetratricopeptide repeat protein [Christiangramia echinicola]|uniref:tetratricopeptide repeat protein n=1 Tax=Christiangramia echinicola TaxID=279359 RepID=UPI0004099CAD|nr:tetratricopeptide repeat protein [Christiangramia echinicola]
MRFKITIITVLAFSLSVIAQEKPIKIADSLAAVGKHKDAIDLLRKVSPKSDNIYLKLAKFQQVEGKTEEALENYRTALEKAPGRVLTAQDYGELLLESGKIDLADSVFTSLSESYPDNAGFVFRLGLVKEKKKDSTAIKYFFKTLSKDFTHQGASYKAAKYYLKNGKSYNAISFCNSGLKERPNNASLLSILGQSYSRSLQFEKAIEPYEKLIALGEGSEFILEKLAKAYRVSGQNEKAIETYKKMLEINDMNAAVHSNLGAIYLKKDEVEKAQEHFMKALFINNQPVDSEYINLGLTYKRQEDYRSAYISFQKALKENPDNERAQIELALAADAHFDDKKAVLKLYEEFLQKNKDQGRKDMISIAEYRISEIKKEIHLSE